MPVKSMTGLLGATAMLTALTAHAQLVTTDGGLGVYDPSNNVTWTSNADLMATQAASYSGGATAFVSTVIADAGGAIGTHTLSVDDFNTDSGQMDWWGAQAWVNYLDVTDYGGSKQWALPTTVDSDSSIGSPNGGAGNPAVSSSQLAELFYGDLGQEAGSSITATHNASYSLFSNVQSYEYWSSTEYSASPNDAWFFSTSNGGQSYNFKFNDYYGLAVSPGDVSAVPEPGAAWLLGVGLLGLMGLGSGRRKAETLAPL